jgi:hypothetical protein
MKSPAAISRVSLFVVALLVAHAGAADLLVHLPPGRKCAAALALTPSDQPGQDGPGVAGKVQGQTISFTELAPGTPYDLRISLADGTVLHGVNMAWYTSEPASADAGLVDDDDRKQIGALVMDVKSFYDISRILAISGNHERATVLVERIRSSGFESGARGEVIWRVELWYFTNDFGGWSELQQTNKVLLRDRFKSRQEYEATVGPLRWIPMLGGIVLPAGGAAREIAVPADAVAATQPAN